jgi:carbon-monoxide dehydrogenase medium subunit
LGAVTPTIVHAQAAEKYLLGRKLDAESINAAADLALESASPIDDVRSSAAYRVEMVRVAVRRLLQDLAHAEQPTRLPDHPIILDGGNDEASKVHKQPSIVHRNEEHIISTVNGTELSLPSGQDKTLLRWLREDALLIGTKEGCAEGECGACTVFLDGEAVMSCLVPAPRAHGAEVITIEGLSSTDKLHPLQQTFIEEGAVQCGYCTPGFIMSGAKLLEESPHPSLDQAKQAITGNLCRCTGYYKILDAIQLAGQMEAEK